VGGERGGQEAGGCVLSLSLHACPRSCLVLVVTLITNVVGLKHLTSPPTLSCQGVRVSEQQQQQRSRHWPLPVRLFVGSEVVWVGRGAGRRRVGVFCHIACMHAQGPAWCW
jgi:hypothetical protein